MARIRVSTTIDAPPAVVWDAIEDLATHVEWMEDAVAIRFTTAQTSGVGTVFECDTKIGPISLVDVMEITEWKPGRAMAPEVRRPQESVAATKTGKPAAKGVARPAAGKDKPAGKGKAVEKIEGGSLYRTFVTGFASRDAAAAFCERLKAAGKSCFVK